MNSPSWPDVINARETEEKRKGKSKIEKPHSDVDAQNTETNDCVAFWDREIPEMNTLVQITHATVQRSEAISGIVSGISSFSGQQNQSPEKARSVTQ